MCDNVWACKCRPGNEDITLQAGNGDTDKPTSSSNGGNDGDGMSGAASGMLAFGITVAIAAARPLAPKHTLSHCSDNVNDAFS